MTGRKNYVFWHIVYSVLTVNKTNTVSITKLVFTISVILLPDNIWGPISSMYVQMPAVGKTILPSLLLVWEQSTFQGILLSPHNVNQRVLQRVHTETIKGPCSLLLKQKTTISVLTFHITIWNCTSFKSPEVVCYDANSR